jgi:LPXTG-motif cell wall-anchored protein
MAAMNKTNLPQSLVSSNSATGSVSDIRAIKQPVPIPNIWLWTALGLGLLLLALLGWWFWRKRRNRPALVETKPVIPPHEKARAKLQEALGLLDQPRPFCILVSDTIRIYLEERFELRAPERTTEEFLEELQSSPALTYDQKRALGEFLTSCDLVKFARYEPGTAELQAIYDSAVRLVRETEPPPLVSQMPSPTPEPSRSP